MHDASTNNTNVSGSQRLDIKYEYGMQFTVLYDNDSSGNGIPVVEKKPPVYDAGFNFSEFSSRRQCNNDSRISRYCSNVRTPSAGVDTLFSHKTLHSSARRFYESTVFTPELLDTKHAIAQTENKHAQPAHYYGIGQGLYVTGVH